MDIRKNVGKNTFLFISLPFFALLLYFELSYLMSYDTGECPIFGVMVYNAPCRIFSLFALFLGMSILILFLAGRLRASFGAAVAYFTLTFFVAWSWVMSAKALASAGIFLSLLCLYYSPNVAKTSRSLREATSLVIYTFVFLVFLLSAVSYVFYFSWVCQNAYSGLTALLCSVVSYIAIGVGLVSPLLWRKGHRIPALVALLVGLLFMRFVVRILIFSRLTLALVAVLFAIELLGEEFVGGGGDVLPGS